MYITNLLFTFRCNINITNDLQSLQLSYAVFLIFHIFVLDVQLFIYILRSMPIL